MTGTVRRVTRELRVRAMATGSPATTNAPTPIAMNWRRSTDSVRPTTLIEDPFITPHQSNGTTQRTSRSSPSTACCGITPRRLHSRTRVV
jgi:hypothetical protein